MTQYLSTWKSISFYLELHFNQVFIKQSIHLLPPGLIAWSSMQITNNHALKCHRFIWSKIFVLSACKRLMWLSGSWSLKWKQCQRCQGTVWKSHEITWKWPSHMSNRVAVNKILRMAHTSLYSCLFAHKEVVFLSALNLASSTLAKMAQAEASQVSVLWHAPFLTTCGNPVVTTMTPSPGCLLDDKQTCPSCHHCSYQHNWGPWYQPMTNMWVSAWYNLEYSSWAQPSSELWTQVTLLNKT